MSASRAQWSAYLDILYADGGNGLDLGGSYAGRLQRL